MTNNQIENEIKIRIANRETVLNKLASLGFHESKPRVFEANTLYDRDGELRSRGEVLRLREAGSKHVLTFKGPGKDGPHKSREELETEVSSLSEVAAILERLAFKRVFRYEKYRTEFEREGEVGTVTVDQTPIGDFLELEGPAPWIDATANELGFEPSDYVLESYGKLYVSDCQRRGAEPSEMVFSS